ncbi:MAG: hydroxymethylbilane synthase, partial [Simkaniaceae bacterium]|nr:hydroxymethylbilane synthase [Simkaniaceae bacterium]
KDLDKTDFFSRDIDKAQIERKCRIAIHSAKDLMDPLPEGLKLIALTTGLDPSDVLVFRSKSHLKALPKGSCIGCSSSRRENAVKKLREDLVFKEVRGPIERRLEALEKEEVDGLVVAEAAILRLKLTHLNRIKLPYVAAPLQGQLAVTALENDREMEELFATIDSR